ncbi:DUF5829 family protein [Amycolatopsis sp. NPDC059021]|uniref:DUF5829 family protein n=1 Tax=Amycolatopsis sp. NPDC059021 TaxID=3346704 RepID=UPI003671C28F
MLIRRTMRKTLALTAALALTLTGAGAAQAEENPPVSDRQLLFFNHAYGVFDRETADAIEHSAYLKEFASFQVRTTTGTGGQKWTGRYLMGRETYLELFGVGDIDGQSGALGSAGMGTSVERSGDLAKVTERLKDEGVAHPLQFLQTRDFGDGVPVPWFDAVLTSEQYDAFDTWGMEYRPEYFADPRSKTEPERFPGDVGRERYLNNDYRDHQMRDVAGIHLAVTERDLANTVPLLKAGGFVVRTVPGGVVALRGGTTIRFDAVPRAQAGLRQIDLTLNRPVADRHEERIGRSTLVVGPGPRAVWTFPANG